MEREVGGGIGMGNTCKPMAVSFQCMTKSTTKKKTTTLTQKKKENSVTVYEVKYIWKMKIFATQFRQLHNILGTKI